MGGSVASVLLGGGVSGGLGEIVNQEFDRKFGGKTGFDLEKIAMSGGIGAVANVLSTTIINRLTAAVGRTLSESLAQTRTSAYRKLIRTAILERSPRIGSRELNIAINTDIKNVQNSLRQQASSAITAATQAISRGIDYLTDKFKDASQNKN